GWLPSPAVQQRRDGADSAHLVSIAYTPTLLSLTAVAGIRATNHVDFSLGQHVVEFVEEKCRPRCIDDAEEHGRRQSITLERAINEPLNAAQRFSLAALSRRRPNAEPRSNREELKRVTIDTPE